MDLLPSELRAIIIGFLDDKSRRWMRLASTQWFNLIRYNNFTVHFTTQEQLPQIVERLAKYNFPLELAFVKRKYYLRKEDFELIGRLTQLVKLDILQEIDAPLLLTNLTNLEYTPTFPPAIARHFTKCKNLVIRSIEDAKEMDLHRFSNIESLTWALPREQPTADPLTMCPHKNSVTSLQIHFVPRDTIDEANLAHYPNLKQLDLRIGFKKISNKVINLPHLPYLETLCTNFDRIGSLAPLSNTLTRLTITCENFDSHGLVELRRLRYLQINIGPNITELNSFEFLTALTNLESYTFSSTGLKTWGEETQYITSQKLTSFSQSAFSASYYQIERLTKFGNLLSLDLDRIEPSPESAEVLGKMCNLTYLRSCKVKADLLPKIETLTNLKRLALTPENATALGPTELVRIEKLKALEVFSFSSTYNESYRRIDDDRIHSLPLKSILINWPVGEKFLENLCAIKTLEAIVLQQAHVSDSSIAHLATLPNLTRLSFTDAGAVTVLALTVLTSLQVLAIRSAKQLSPTLDQTLLQSMPKLYEVRMFLARPDFY